MSKAVNTIARSIEAGALKAGASQYLEAIEAAQRQLADNQILVVTYASLVETTSLRKKFISLYTYESSVTTITRVNDAIEVYLPNTITNIGEGAFAYLDTLEKITIPTSLKSIGPGAFATTINIKEDIILPDGLETIGDEAFADAGINNSIAIHIPSSVTLIGENAFGGVAHIYYNGTATGAPWGAQAMN